jgi:uncharacterized protein (DUF111 family)
MGNSHDNQIHKFIEMAVKELEQDIKKQLGERIMEEYLDQVEKELLPRIEEMVNSVNIKDFAIVREMTRMRDDLKIKVIVEDQRG